MHALSHIKTALVLEDDFLLATDLEATLRRQGCQKVMLAGDVTSGLQIIATREIEFATLDIRLRNNDCSRLLDVLVAMSVPFVYVTGFSQNSHPLLPSAPWANKPYEEGRLLEAALAVCPVNRRAVASTNARQTFVHGHADQC